MLRRYLLTESLFPLEIRAKFADKAVGGLHADPRRRRLKAGDRRRLLALAAVVYGQDPLDGRLKRGKQIFLIKKT
jgi:hypothetical protein